MIDEAKEANARHVQLKTLIPHGIQVLILDGSLDVGTSGGNDDIRIRKAYRNEAAQRQPTKSLLEVHSLRKWKRKRVTSVGVVPLRSAAIKSFASWTRARW